MSKPLAVMSYTFAALSGVCLVSGMAILSNEKRG